MGVRNQRKTRTKRWDGDIQGLEPIGHGVSGMVFGIDNKRVAKIDIGTDRSIEDIETEREVYRILSRDPDPSPYVLRCYEFDNPSGLVLQRCNDTVRKCLRRRYRNDSPPAAVVKMWVYGAAQGLARIHKYGIVQGDVGCHNLLLDKCDAVKLADFAGSSIHGLPSTVDYDVRSKLPGSDEPDETSDIFALGSAIWEIATGTLPYNDKSWSEVQGLYKRGIFPMLKKMPELGRIIIDCWQQSYGRAQEIVRDLEEAFPELVSATSTSEPEDSPIEVTPSKPDREPASTFTYVELAMNRRRKFLKYKDSDRWKENHGRKGEKRGKVRSPGFLLKWFSPTRKYDVKV